MADELRQYYENELKFLRDMGVEFREKYPKIAARLSLAETSEADHHVRSEERRVGKECRL